MPLNGLNVGKDVSLVINTSKGVQRFTYITSFDANPTTGDLKSIGLDGRARHAIVHEGWEGELDFDRDSSTFDDFWAQLEADYYAGMDQASGTINETITEVGGGLSQYRYDNVVFKLKSTGPKKGNDLIKGKMGFFAERRIKVA